MKIVRFVLVTLILAGCYNVFHAQASDDINTLLMKTTFEILGPSVEPNKTTYGTVFVLGKPVPGAPDHAYRVLVTAAHVLDGIAGDDATLKLRRFQNDSYVDVPFPLKIRQSGKPLYIKHKTADIAVMYVPLPQALELRPLSVEFLATDAQIEKLEIRPGDELMCLGFPLNISLNTFPVLRSGLLASYPLTPSALVGQYFYNFHVFPGNSGGPVYFKFPSRNIGGTITTATYAGVIGLVTQEKQSKIPGFENAPLDISVIVPSTLILETLNLLPSVT